MISLANFAPLNNLTFLFPSFLLKHRVIAFNHYSTFYPQVIIDVDNLILFCRLNG